MFLKTQSALYVILQHLQTKIKPDLEMVDLVNELIINNLILEEILSHCKAEFPYEACGILAGKDNVITKVYKAKNIERTSYSYFMDSREQYKIMKEIKDNNLKMICIYHSHPYSVPYPSPKDISLAFYEDIFYMIIGFQHLNDNESTGVRPLIKVFSIKNNNVNEIAYKILDYEKL